MVAFDQWVADATEAGIASKKRKARPRVHVREAIEAVAETADMTSDVAVVRAVLREIGFESAGFDAMSDEEVDTLLSRASTIRQLLRAWRKQNPGVQDDQA